MHKVRTKTWNGQSARYVQLKMDGHYTRIVTGEFGRTEAFTSHPTNITQQVRNYNWFRPHYSRVPFGTVILGELWVPHKTSSDVKTALVEQWPDLMFSAFAVESIRADAPLEDVAKFCHYYGIDFIRWRRVVTGDTVEKLMENLPEEAEGYVLKDGNLLNWYKLKPVKTIDLIVEDFTEGDGKYSGAIGSIICRTIEGYEIANVSGMTDEIRWEISADPVKYVGKVLEVEYQRVGSRGRLRHPRFVRWRDDKLPEQCGLNQDPELEELWSIGLG